MKYVLMRRSPTFGVVYYKNKSDGSGRCWTKNTEHAVHYSEMGLATHDLKSLFPRRTRQEMEVVEIIEIEEEETESPPRLRGILDELLGEGAITKDEHQTAVRELDEARRIGDRFAAGALPWRPIAELDPSNEENRQLRYSDEAGFLLLAPELADLDCNVHGVGMGFWQDDGKLWAMSQEQVDQFKRQNPDAKDLGCWLACKWYMSRDCWNHVEVNPTHYLRLRGVE